MAADLNLNREAFEQGLPRSLAYYTAACQRYGVETDAGVLSALRFGKSKLRTSAEFRDKGMLPLVVSWLRGWWLSFVWSVLLLLSWSYSSLFAPPPPHTHTSQTGYAPAVSRGDLSLPRL